MIRVTVEGGLQAMFYETEKVMLCRDILGGEYILDEAECRAKEIEKRFAQGYQYIFLDRNLFSDIPSCGIVRDCDSDGYLDRKCDSLGAYRITRVRATPNDWPAFIANRRWPHGLIVVELQ
jgi:hypothetical protein